MSDVDFKSAFKRDKPTEDTYVIFSCHAGRRAQRATDLALTHGFKKYVSLLIKKASQLCCFNSFLIDYFSASEPIPVRGLNGLQKKA